MLYEVITWEYDVIAPGYKYNMPDINAAIGLAQLEKAESMREKRQKVVEFYYDELKDVDLLDLPVSKVPFKHHSWHIFHFRITSYNVCYTKLLRSKSPKDLFHGLFVSVIFINSFHFFSITS